MLHGMGLTVGLINEQERPDRDQYIEVNYQNIPEDWHSQYEKVSDKEFFHSHPYDYGSVMHYPMTARGIYKDAFEVRQPLVDAKKIGKMKRLSVLDIDKINNLYKME
ncbi:metalloendopeptidase [Trichonephila clavata]|uniref:Metalloendopeptidase n=1 Tax=Trichonephila clavata TaxID=2740835 RepID=A0A8X6GJC9_TRICU|nr:metalloendopeptidase [Trichonephila clavata]